MNDHLLLDIQDSIATITFNRPEARNALSMEMRDGLADAMTKVEMDSRIRCVVLRGAGGNFMGGGDIKVMKSRQELDPETRKAEALKGLHTLHFAVYSMRRMAKPIVAAVQGAVAGAGVSLVAACDLAIADESSFFVLAYANIGLCPDASSTYFLPRLMGVKQAAELMYLAERFGAEEARSLGLINRVVPAGAFEDELAKLAGRLAIGPTYAYGRGKALLEGSLNHTLETQLELEGQAIAAYMTTADHAEGVNAFLEKRKPQFKGN